ncbi:MAG TPA: hypothetical protein VFN57_09280, partial [Thermomicrobiaceae bacterium]|nr:hypothetical protein [Thermomicrobiaceae bacterium]
CVGNSIQAWVNGTQVARATDSTYTGGRTFLGVGVDANFNRGGGLVEGWFKGLMVTNRHRG